MPRGAIQKELDDMPSIVGRGGALQQLLAGSIQERDTSVQVRSDQTAADGVNHVFVKCLEAQKLSALILQFAAGLPQLGCEGAGQMRNGQIGEKVDQDDCLQRLGVPMRRNLIRRNFFKIGKLKERSEKDE